MLKKDEERAKLLLTWIQDAISFGQLRDPGVQGVEEAERLIYMLYKVLDDGSELLQ